MHSNLRQITSLTYIVDARTGLTIFVNAVIHVCQQVESHALKKTLPAPKEIANVWM